jgi:preprotein translocase SecF subunit
MRLLKLVPDNTNLHFMRWRRVAVALSVLMMVAAVALVAIRGLNFGVDFSGGLMLEVRFAAPAPLDELRRTVNRAGAGEAALQSFGDSRTVAIRLPLPVDERPQAVQERVQKVQAAIRAAHPDADFRRVETVSGKVSGELIRDGAMAILFAMVGISIYIWFRFEWQFGLGAVLALIHDVLATIGVFAFLQMEFNLTTIAALLTIVGYSMNDTVVVFDRIRENLRKFKKMDLGELIDLSINETLARTIMTSATTLIALFALFIFGGEVIRSFTFAMIFGIFVGTYSSIFVAAPILIATGIKRDWGTALGRGKSGASAETKA